MKHNYSIINFIVVLLCFLFFGNYKTKAQNTSYDLTAGDHTTLTGAAAALSNRTTFTLEFWANFDSVSGIVNLVDFTNSSDAGGLILNSGSLNVDLSNDFFNLTSSTALTLSTGTWYHIAIVFDNGTWDFYVDGTAYGTNVPDNGAHSAVPDYTAAFVNDMVFGPQDHGSVSDFTGGIDDIRLWSTARTQSDIQNNRSQELAGNEFGLIGYWKLNETSGTTVNDSQTNTTTLNGTSSGVTQGGAGAFSTAPTVSDGNISISGATGTGGTFKIGDTVTASWNNTAGGDNNSGITGVTVDFSQFGGGAAVVATNSSETWTATYTITAGAIDGTNLNVSVTATNATGPTTTADTTNATVDSIAPLVSNASIGISGATGSGGAFKIGDTVTASWDNSAFGDDNSDTISSATVDFSAFGGSAAVTATNSSGTWTATYTIVSGGIDAANRNVSVTATDNAGNTTTTADTSNATVDNIAPVVSNASIGISGATGTGGAYKIGDTVTASWDNSAFGDDNSDTISGATVDFSAFGGSAAVTATNSSGTWTATYTIVSGGIDAANRNVSVTATDNAGNTTTTADTSNATVDNIAPSVSNASIGISGATGTGGAYKIGDTVTASWDNSAFGDDNSDTISGATVDFSAFGGSAAVTATNSSGTWTATYTIVSGGIDAANRNVSVTATDNAGNTTTTADTSNATVDNIAPTVNSVSVPANGTYITGQNLDFTVNTNENVTVNTGGGTPRITLTVGATTRQASYLSGNGTSAIVFRYTVQAGDNDTNGIEVAASIDVNGGTMRDGTGNDLNTTLNSVGSTTSVLVDAVSPTVSSVSVPANDTYITGQNLDFTVNTNENVTVNTGGGTPQIVLTVGATARQASYLSGSGTSALVFRYTIQAGDNDDNGIAVAASIDVNGGTLRDGAGNDLNTTLNSVGATADVLVDAVVPSVSTINRVTTALSNASTVDYTVTFTENVTGVNTPDFTLTFTGTADGTVASVTAINASTYTVTVNSITGDGTMRLDLNNAGTGIADSAGNAIASGFTSGQTYTFDHTAPNVSSVAVPANATYITGQNLDFTINFSENITVNTGGGIPQISITIGSTTRQATYTSGSGTGALLFRYTVQSGELDTDGIAVGTLAANGGTLRDGAGNDATLTLNSVGSTTAVLVGYATVTWTGATNNNWTTASNWDINEVPSSAADVIIPSGLTNYPTASSPVTFNSLTINSGASFIPQSTVTGNITYKRNLPTTDWYLISMPIAGEVMEDIITIYPLASGTGSNLGLSSYQNSGSAWGYVTAATTGSFINGYGYSIKLTTSGDLSVTGTANTSDVSSSITTGSRTNFNLLGNPFTAYINSATFTATNTALLSEETVWLWNGTQYVAYNAVSPIEIAPVQGFFVESSGNGNVVFSTSNLSHQTSGTFMKQTSNNEQETLSSFELFVSGKSEQSSTKVFFVDGKTNGFDNGYDSKLFGEVDYTFVVYTGMVLGNDSKKLAIQTLPSIGAEVMKIPVGLIAEAGKTITFSVQAKNLPTGVGLILEDKLNNTYVNLLEGDHSVTLKNTVTGLGKFYIHTTAKLNTEDIENVSSIRIYKSAAKELSIEGLIGLSQVVLYSLTGEKVMQREIRSDGINKIDLQKFPIGIYIVRVSSESGSVTKKIILE